jgi:hypothetical protein
VRALRGGALQRMQRDASRARRWPPASPAAAAAARQAEAGAQALGSRASASAVADGFLSAGASSAEEQTARGHEEQRVVAEAALPRGAVSISPCHSPSAMSGCGSSCANAAAPARRHSGRGDRRSRRARQQPGVVARVARGAVAFDARVVGGVHARLAAQRRHAQAGVVGERRQAGELRWRGAPWPGRSRGRCRCGSSASGMPKADCGSTSMSKGANSAANSRSLPGLLEARTSLSEVGAARRIRPVRVRAPSSARRPVARCRARPGQQGVQSRRG